MRQLVEPRRALFKDEVRAIGRELGLPAEIVGRQPFPGPGLAIRIPGEITPERVAILLCLLTIPYAINELLPAVAYLLGGWGHMRAISRQTRETFIKEIE